jgi:hypothetical protein
MATYNTERRAACIYDVPSCGTDPLWYCSAECAEHDATYPESPDPYDDADWRDDYTDDDHERVEDYCDYCEREGHTYRSCPRRDDGDS